MDKGLSSLLVLLAKLKEKEGNTVLYLEAVFEPFADKIEDDGVYAGVDWSKVDTQVIQDQQETRRQNKRKSPVMFGLFLSFQTGEIINW